MSDEIEQPKKRSKLPILIGLVLAIVGAAGGFFVSTGALSKPATEPTADIVVVGAGQAEFVPLDPFLISLAGDGAKVLRFSAQLDVQPAFKFEVEMLAPRIIDVLNVYLRSVRPTDFEQPGIMPVLRGQMLRRIELVVGKGRVNDLLIMEMIIN